MRFSSHLIDKKIMGINVGVEMTVEEYLQLAPSVIAKNEYQRKRNYYSIKYVGQWKGGLKDGQGSFTTFGSDYTGEWKNDKMHGQGTYIKAEGTVYKGLFENNNFIGK